MKNLLICQSSEYDCGPVSLINGIAICLNGKKFFPISSNSSCSIVWIPIIQRVSCAKGVPLPPP